MKKPISNIMGSWRLRISGSISLGIHLLLIFTATFLFSGTEVRQTPIRHVKVILYPREEEKKPIPKFVPPLPVKNQIERPVTREPIQEEKQKEVFLKKEYEPPVPLPVQVTVRDIPAEEPKLGLLPREEEKMAKKPANASEPVLKKEHEPPALLPVQMTVRDIPAEESKLDLLPGEEEKIAKGPANAGMNIAFDKASNLKKEENLSAPSLPGTLKRNTLSQNASGQGAGVGAGSGQGGSPIGEPGHALGTGREGFSSRGSDEGKGIGQGGPGVGDPALALETGRGEFLWRASEEGRAVGQGGSPKGGTGSGSGEKGSPKGGSQKGVGVLGRLFSFSGGARGAYAGYAENPKPSYPEEARKKGMEGEVLLRVEVLANGRAGRLELKKSSGHEILDRSALTAVKEWRFTPANPGNGSISCWVNIPIKFRLQ